MSQFKVVNIDRLRSLPGCGPFDHDFSVVLSANEQEPHPITGHLQPKCLYRGTLRECHNWVKSQSVRQ
jgi:hypothetical protein